MENTKSSSCLQNLDIQGGNSYEDFMLLLSSKWVSVKEAGAIFVWPPHRH